MKYCTAAIVLYGLFFLMCYMGTGTLKKNMSSTNYDSYADSLQEKIRQDSRLKEMVPRKKNVWLTFFSNLLVFTIVFVLVGLLLQIQSFYSALLYFLLLGEGLNLFDFLVIDLCWWRHTKRVRIDSIGTEAEYQDIHKHLASFLRAVPLFAAAALLTALILSVL